MNAEQRVLIIDSDLKNCKAIKYALIEYGIGAYYTLSVIDGMQRLNRHNYELVILDISLSETDGLQLLRFMRHLVLSSQGGIERRERTISWKRPWNCGSACSGPSTCSEVITPPPSPCPASGATPSLHPKTC